MLASKTIISADGILAPPAHLFEVGGYFIFINIGERFSEPVGGRLQFGEMSRRDLFSGRRDVDAKSFATAGHGHRRIGLKKARNLLSKLANSNLYSLHWSSPCVHISVRKSKFECKEE
jgi:hypothetical protein